MMSICTGAFVLAAAGLLDGRPATTHWLHTAAFRRLFPAVRLDPDVLFVDDGDVLTSAGVAAGIDLCLHVVRRDHGSAVANRVARRCVVPPWRDGGQSQFIEPLAEVAGEDDGRDRAWALDRLDEPLALADLAAHAAMSVRTFTRRFRDETGVSPARWLTDRRVEQARRLLETTELPVDRVAAARGLRHPDRVAPAPARRDRRGPADLPAHLPRGALSCQRRASLAQVASCRSKRSRRMRWSTYSSPVTPARNGEVNVVTITVNSPIAR